MAVMLGRRSCTVYVDLATTSECAPNNHLL